jgi:tRNA (mo5U34)-methyltransferase
MPAWRSLRVTFSRLLHRGRATDARSVGGRGRREGPLARTAARRYGASYKAEPLPAGLSPEQLRAYVGRTGWYHQIELGNDVLTPGMKSKADIDREWDLAGLTELAGKSVLDIGGVDGAYAFLAEQHGAERVAVLDHYLWATDAERYTRIYREHVDAGRTPPAPHESDAWYPDTLPTRWRFDTARQALGSRVEAMALDFADCDLAEVGEWDIVLYLGVLYHMPDPVRAVRRVAEVTREQAIIETEAMFIPSHPEALWRFFAAGELNHDRSNWWVPNINALLGLVGAAGFANAEILAGEPMTDARAGDGPHHYRAIVRAIK